MYLIALKMVVATLIVAGLVALSTPAVAARSGSVMTESIVVSNEGGANPSELLRTDFPAIEVEQVRLKLATHLLYSLEQIRMVKQRGENQYFQYDNGFFTVRFMIIRSQALCMIRKNSLLGVATYLDQTCDGTLSAVAINHNDVQVTRAHRADYRRVLRALIAGLNARHMVFTLR